MRWNSPWSKHSVTFYRKQRELGLSTFWLRGNGAFPSFLSPPPSINSWLSVKSNAFRWKVLGWNVLYLLIVPMTPPVDLTAESNGAYQIMVKWKVIRLFSLFFFNIIVIIIILLFLSSFSRTIENGLYLSWSHLQSQRRIPHRCLFAWVMSCRVHKPNTKWIKPGDH